MNRITTLIQRLEDSHLTFWHGAFLLYGTFFIRTFLENFANAGNFYHMSGVVDTFFHYPLFFLIAVTATVIIATILTGERVERAAKFVVLSSGIIILPPVVDLIITAGGQVPYIFIIGDFSELATSFLTYLGGGAVGIGIKTEVAIALLGIGAYIFTKTKSFKRAAMGVISLYAVIFLLLTLPSIIFSAQNMITHTYEETSVRNVADYYFRQEPAISNTNVRSFIFENNNSYNPVRNVQNQYATTLSVVFLIIQIALFSGVLLLYSPQKFFTVVKNFRYLRIMHYFLLTVAGISLAKILFPRKFEVSLFDALSFAALGGALIFAWLFTVWENDEADLAIDKISSPERPLTRGHVSLPEWRVLKRVFLIFSLSFAFLSGLYTLVFVILFIFIYHIYSVPPLRLKRFLGISSLIIAINALLAVLMGFFTVAGTENLGVFPAKYALGIIVIFLLAENVKNIKDREGDEREGIKTLPVVLGERRGKFIIGSYLFAASFLVPIMFNLSRFSFFFAVTFGILFFLLTNRKSFREEYIFLTYFAYAVVLFAFEIWR